MRRSARRLLSVLVFATGLPACGDGESHARPASARAFRLPVDTTRQLPLDSLYGVPAVGNLRVTPVEIHMLGLPAGLDGTRVAVLSDLQLGLWADNSVVAAAAARRAAELDPDFVVLLGDYLARGDSTDALRRVLAPLRGRRVFAVLGDRDVRSDSAEARVTRALQESGATVLRNERAFWGRGRDTLAVAGVDPELVADGTGTQEYVMSTLVGPATVLLTHYPGLAPRIPSAPSPAVLAGGTFCGRVEVPGTPRLSWLEGELLRGVRTPGVERLYRLKNGTLFVTCGLGYSFVPVRFGAPPEVALVTLRSVGATAPAAPAAPAVPDSLIERFERTDPAAPPADTTAPPPEP